MKKQPVRFDQLSSVDVIVDQSYLFGPGGLAGEPLNKLIGGTVNQGGFRHSKPKGLSKPLYCILVATNENPAWPNSLDQETGSFTYYGDNIMAGSDIHDTKGNQILRDAFADASNRLWSDVPLFMVFESTGGTAKGYIFRGLAVPGGPTGVTESDLIAVWKSDKTGRRFQNYRARFTILDTGPVAMTRKWLEEIKAEHSVDTPSADKAWKTYSKTGKVTPLTALPTMAPRTEAQQKPSTELEADILRIVVGFHKDMGRDGNYFFERTANRICGLMLSGVTSVSGTKKSGDGGYDGIGTLKLGTAETNVSLHFLVEAKLYSGPCGVSQTKRLLSRLKTQTFGIFVTNSVVGAKAQKEIIKDGQKVILISGGDIAKILIRSGISTKESVLSWLKS